MLDFKFAKFATFINCAVPLVLLAWDAYYHRLGVNPLEFVTHTTGTLTLVFLTLTIAVTPLRKLLAFPRLIQLRRMMGLYAFFYGCLHLLCYVWFDKSFAFGAIAEDTLKRPFIFLGMLSFLIMLPLAITSTNKMVKRIGGKRWNRLHKLVYAAAIAGVIHYYLLVKADTRIPIGFGIVVACLLTYRIINKYFPSYTQRSPLRAERQQ